MSDTCTTVGKSMIYWCKTLQSTDSMNKIHSVLSKKNSTNDIVPTARF